MAGVWVTDHRQGACGHWEYPDGLKTCSICGKDLPLESFSVHGYNKDGTRSLNVFCKDCRRVKDNAAYKLKHPVPRPRAKFKEYLDNKKKCTQCKTEKDLSEFYVKNYKGLKRPVAICKTCVDSNSIKWVDDNREKRRKIAREYYYRNRQKVAEYVQRNSAKFNYRGAKRRSMKLQATPLWTEDSHVKLIYSLASEWEKTTGIKYHVDHMVPLKSDYVCGLHTEHNLDIIPAADNISKNNRH